MISDANDGFSYFVFGTRFPALGSGDLQRALDRLGADGWDLVTSVTMLKTVATLRGDDLFLLFKKAGAGHPPPNLGPTSPPTEEQLSYLRQLLASKAMSEDELAAVEARLRASTLWTESNLGQLNVTLYPMSLEEVREQLAGI